jgi:threonine-phosphate decarboxylase
MRTPLHGGDVLGFERVYGRTPLDFSANVNPFGMPPAVRRAARRAVLQSDVYPDPFCRRLTRAIAAHEGVKPRQVLPGAGAADLIFRLVYAARPRRALLPAPTFSEYERALTAAGGQPVFHALRGQDGFALTERILDDLRPDVDMLILCNPNNPTGLACDPALLQQILARCRACGIRPVIDECFLAFLPDFARRTLRRSLAAHPGLVILDAFTKLYAVAGLRLGYALSDDEALLSDMIRAGPPWAVSAPAQAAGLAALAQDGWVSRCVGAIARQRDWLGRSLADCGCEVFDSQANYIFLRAPREDFGQALAERGFFVRDCRNFRGLESGGYYRVAVRRPADNRRLIAAVRGL